MIYFLILYVWFMATMLTQLVVNNQELRVMRNVFDPFLDERNRDLSALPLEERLRVIQQELQDLEHYKSVADTFYEQSIIKKPQAWLLWRTLPIAWWGRSGRCEQYWSQRLNG